MARRPGRKRCCCAECFSRLRDWGSQGARYGSGLGCDDDVGRAGFRVVPRAVNNRRHTQQRSAGPRTRHSQIATPTAREAERRTERNMPPPPPASPIVPYFEGIPLEAPLRLLPGDCLPPHCVSLLLRQYAAEEYRVFSYLTNIHEPHTAPHQNISRRDRQDNYSTANAVHARTQLDTAYSPAAPPPAHGRTRRLPP